MVLVRCATGSEWGGRLGRGCQGRSDEHVRAYSNNEVSRGGACSDGHGHQVTGKGEPLDGCSSGGVGDEKSHRCGKRRIHGDDGRRSTMVWRGRERTLWEVAQRAQGLRHREGVVAGGVVAQVALGWGGQPGRWWHDTVQPVAAWTAWVADDGADPGRRRRHESSVGSTIRWPVAVVRIRAGHTFG